MIQKFRSWLYFKAYPTFSCENCIGLGFEHGCQCDYHGAIAPGKGPTLKYKILRCIYQLLG